MEEKQQISTYEGCNFLRQRLVLSSLTGRPVRIINIREKDVDPGLREHEASFIRLLDQISNGSRIEINDTGTVLMYRPGVLMGGRVEHSCPAQRGIGYFLEPLFMLAPFCKKSLDITLKGVTNNKVDPTFDMIKYSLLPVLKKFLVVDEGLSLTMVKRGLPPNGGGIIKFSCPVRRSLKAFQWLECGKIKRIRGTAFTSRIAPTVANRMLDAAKGEFLKFLTDVYITCDNGKGSSPGFGICMTAETNKGSHYTGESLECKEEEEKTPKLPEDVGREAAWHLLEEIYRGGCVDALSQCLVLLFMVLAPKDVSKVVFGPLTPYTMHFLQHIRDFFNVTFKIDEYVEKGVLDEEEQSRTGAGKLLLTCVGVGYTNIGKGQT
ncbi:RNA terminal phosphate cyclase 1 [Oratosquilla oratoria]|uniref:RNA terminal phosphate cyclase 1 n=1 Tax=Oratosquilla oratoria TaxID=337810 RepID=UPI003F75EEB9